MIVFGIVCIIALFSRSLFLGSESLLGNLGIAYFSCSKITLSGCSTSKLVRSPCDFHSVFHNDIIMYMYMYVCIHIYIYIYIYISGGIACLTLLV